MVEKTRRTILSQSGTLFFLSARMYKLIMVADRNDDKVIRTMFTQKNAPGKTQQYLNISHNYRHHTTL